MIRKEDLDHKRAELRLQGVNVSAWAAERGFSKEMVYAVLHGRTKAYRGQAHQIARCLGLKPAVVEN